MGLRVTVHYPFHPLCGRELDVLCTPRDLAQSIVAVDPRGGHIKIPRWMTCRDAARFHLSDQPDIDARALLALARLLPPGVEERRR
jgi:hypothetical protein